MNTLGPHFTEEKMGKWGNENYIAKLIILNIYKHVIIKIENENIYNTALQISHKIFKSENENQ